MIEAFFVFLFGSVGVFIGMSGLYLAIKLLVFIADRLTQKENPDVS